MIFYPSWTNNRLQKFMKKLADIHIKKITTKLHPAESHQKDRLL